MSNRKQANLARALENGVWIIEQELKLLLQKTLDRDALTLEESSKVVNYVRTLAGVQGELDTALNKLAQTVATKSTDELMRELAFSAEEDE